MTNPELFAKNTILKILEEKGALPTNILKMRLERFGLYQDATGKVIKVLCENENILKEKKINNHPYLYIPHYENVDMKLEMISKLNEEFLKAQTNQSSSGDFNELITYISLCKVLDEHNELIYNKIEPGGQRKVNGFTYKMDAYVMLNGEEFAVEMKNWIDQTMLTHKEMDGFLNNRGPMNPILINRFTSGNVKKYLLKNNGRAADLLKLNILDCHETQKAIEASRELEISEMINWIPHIEVDGENYEGKTFKSHVKEISQEKFIEASNQVPELIHKNIRGLIRLLFLATEYRRFMRTERYPPKRNDILITKLLGQYSYEHLLYTSKASVTDMFEYATSRIGGFYKDVIEADKGKFLEYLKEELYNYNEYGFAKKYKDTYTVEDAITPDKWLHL